MLKPTMCRANTYQICFICLNQCFLQGPALLETLETFLMFLDRFLPGISIAVSLRIMHTGLFIGSSTTNLSKGLIRQEFKSGLLITCSTLYPDLGVRGHPRTVPNSDKFS